MKKWIAGMVLLCLCLTACGDGSQTIATTTGAQLNATTTTRGGTSSTTMTPTHTAPPTASTTTSISVTSCKPTKTPTYITDLITPRGEGYPYKEEPGPYVMKEVNGQFYIDFGKGNVFIPLQTSDVWYPSAIYFESPEEMYHKLMTGDFTMKELQIIRGNFSVDRDNGFRLFNPKNTYNLSIPAGMIGIICMTRDGITYTARESEGEENQIQVQFELLSEDKFNQQMEAFRRFETGGRSYDELVQIPERNAVAYDRYGNNGNKYRTVQYSYTTGSITIYVEEEYINSTQITEGDPSSVRLYGNANGEYYEISIPFINFVPTVDWLMQFQKTPFVPA